MKFVNYKILISKVGIVDTQSLKNRERPEPCDQGSSVELWITIDPCKMLGHLALDLKVDHSQ